jgi:hypothetical protein
MKLARAMQRLGWWTLALTFIWMIVFMAVGFLPWPGFELVPDRETADWEAVVEHSSRMLTTYFTLFFGGAAFFWLLSMVLIYGASIVNAVNNRSILAKGESAEAIILKISETGMSINDDPVVKFLLDVGPTDRPRFQAEAERLVSRLDIPKFQPGNTVQVKYDPDSRTVALC